MGPVAVGQVAAARVADSAAPPPKAPVAEAQVIAAPLPPATPIRGRDKAASQAADRVAVVTWAPVKAALGMPAEDVVAAVARRAVTAGAWDEVGPAAEVEAVLRSPALEAATVAASSRPAARVMAADKPGPNEAGAMAGMPAVPRAEVAVGVDPLTAVGRGRSMNNT